MGQTSSSPSCSNTPPLLSANLPSPSLSFRDAETSFPVQDLTAYLPDECLAWIFHKLPSAERQKCSLVCKRWHSVDATTRERLALHAEAGLEPNVTRILSRYAFITCLSLRCNRKELSIDDVAIALIGQQCTQLSRLKLKSCKAISDDGLGEFAKIGGHSLKKFSCGSCGFASKGLNLLLENCPKLEDLSVKRLRKMPEYPQAILPGASRLRRLCVKEIMFAHLFESVITGSKHLRTLVLARNPGLWDAFFGLICEHLSELVELHVDSLKMGEKALTAIAKCSSLEVLHVSKVSECSNRGFAAIANGCWGLKKLYIDDRTAMPMGDEGLIALGKHSVKLQELVLIGVSVTKVSLDLILSNCVVLERMALCSTDAVGDAELACIAEKCSSLRKLCIKNCPISDIGMEGLAKGCPNLTKVKVKKCKDVTLVSAVLFKMRRPSVVASLDTPSEVRLEGEELIEGHQDDAIAATISRIRTPLVKSRLMIAAGNFLRRIPKPS
eukprot:c10122_g1_i1 orf=444-1937(+)